jgi:hypothetical protein
MQGQRNVNHTLSLVQHYVPYNTGISVSDFSLFYMKLQVILLALMWNI